MSGPPTGAAPKTAPKFTIFISKRCAHCNSLIANIMTNDDLAHDCSIIEIEKLPGLPQGLTEVPAVFDGKQYFSGKSAFKWFNDISSEYLLPANDFFGSGSSLSCCTFMGDPEVISSSFAPLDAHNGSFGMEKLSEGVKSGGGSASLDSLIQDRANDMSSAPMQ